MSSDSNYFVKHMNGRLINGVRFECFIDEYSHCYYMRCCKCNEIGIPWEFRVTENLVHLHDELGLLHVATAQIEKHARQHGEVSERLYEQITELKKKQTQVKVIVPAGIAKPETLTKREIVQLLEHAVLDGKVKDIILFEYEAGFVSMPPSDVMTILYQYKYGKTNVKIIEPDDDIVRTKRLLRPVE